MSGVPWLLLAVGIVIVLGFAGDESDGDDF